jgi:anti-sigma factor RsiW
MDCATLRERVAPLLDGELEPDELDEAAEHLERCEECAALVERLAEVPVELASSRVPIQPDFWDAMDRALAAEATRAPGPLDRARGWFRGELRITRGAALLYLLVLGLAFGWHLLRPEPPVPELGMTQPEQAAPTPSSPPPPARRSQKIEKASYAPVQQTF